MIVARPTTLAHGLRLVKASPAVAALYERRRLWGPSARRSQTAATNTNQPSTPVACPARDAYNEGVKKKSRARAALRKAAEARLPTRYGTFRIVGLENGRRQWLGGLV